MKLLELEVENWGKHENLRLDLSAGLQISGRNGTGKSSLLEAIRFIFSENSRKYTGKIRRGAEYARVKLRLESGKDIYSIEKRLFVKKPSTAVMWVNRNPVADTTSTVYSRIQEILSENLLDKLVYVPQGRMTEIVQRLGLKGGRQEFDRLFGLDRFEKVYAGVNEEIKIKEAEHSLLCEQIVKYPANALEEYCKEIRGLEHNLREATKKIESERREQHIVEQKIEQLEKKVVDMKAEKKRRENLEREINQLVVEETKALKDIESMKAALNLLSEKKREAEKLEGDAAQLRKYSEVRRLLSDLGDKESRIKLLGDVEAKKKELDESETELNKKYSLEMEYEALSKKIVDLKSKTAVLRQRISEKNVFLKELSSLSGKAVCPKCGQKLQATHILSEKKTAEEEIRKLEKDLNEYSLVLVSEEKKKNPLEKQLEFMRNLEAECKQKKQEYEKAIREREKLLEACGKTKSELNNLGYSGETLKEVEEKVRELQRIEGMISAIKADLLKEKSFEEKIKAAEASLGEIRAKKTEYEKQSNKIIYDEKLLSELENKRDELREKRNKLVFELEKTGNEIRENNKRIDELKAKIEEYCRIDEKAKKLAEEIRLLKDVRDIFHTDKGMVKYLREKYIRQLSLLLTQYFRKINQNPRYRELLFDEDYGLEIKTSEGSFSVEQLSGGELVQVALALRMALLELLSPVRLLILDEPFGSLDKEHREALGEALNKIGLEGQLIVVTHIPVDSLQLPQLDLGGY